MASKLHNALAKKLPDIQMSEAFINCVFLAMSGGLQDAYTYFTRNEVFSNAQTGNVVLMSTHFMMGEWYQGLKYLLPFLAFGLGVFVTERIQGKYKNATRLHWRQAILLIEIIILIAVGFMPHSMDMFATIVVSFSCAMQVQAFRKVNGYSYASTMWYIIMPQAFKNVLPALANEFIVLLKETSICGYIGLMDLTRGGDIIRSRTYNAFMPLLAVALIYLILVMILSSLVRQLERRLRNSER